MKENLLHSQKAIVTISWDDFTDDQREVIDLLDRYSLKGTFYVMTNQIKELDRGGKQVSLKTMKELLDSGHEVASHTRSHPRLTEISQDEIKNELKGSKEDLQSLLRCEIKGLAYPSGNYDNRVKECAQKSGYIYARTIREGALGFPSDRFEFGITEMLPIAERRLRFYFGRSQLSILPLQVKSLCRWEEIAKKLFVKALERGGVWHLMGHYQDVRLDSKLKLALEDVLSYVGGRSSVRYMTNAEIFTSMESSEDREPNR